MKKVLFMRFSVIFSVFLLSLFMFSCDDEDSIETLTTKTLEGTIWTGEYTGGSKYESGHVTLAFMPNGKYKIDAYGATNPTLEGGSYSVVKNTLYLESYNEPFPFVIRKYTGKILVFQALRENTVGNTYRLVRE